MFGLQWWANVVQIISGVIALIGLCLQVVIWLNPQPSSAAFKPVIKFLRLVLPPVIIAATFFWLGASYVSSRTIIQPTAPSATAIAEAVASTPATNPTTHPTSEPTSQAVSTPAITQSQNQLPGVICSVSGRTAVPPSVACTSGALSVSIQVIGRTEYPNWEGAFNGLVSQIDAEPGVTVIDRVELYGPPGKWDTKEVAGSLTLQDSTNMTEKVDIYDEVTNSTINMSPDNISQELQFKFASTMRGKIAAICEFANPCSGQIMTFTYQP